MGLGIPRAFLFGARSLPDPDTAFLAERGIKVFIVPAAGHAMMDDNPDGFAEILAAAFGS